MGNSLMATAEAFSVGRNHGAQRGDMVECAERANSPNAVGERRESIREITDGLPDAWVAVFRRDPTFSDMHHHA